MIVHISLTLVHLVGSVELFLVYKLIYRKSKELTKAQNHERHNVLESSKACGHIEIQNILLHMQNT